MIKYYYELIKTYPNGPTLGTIVNETMNEYIEYDPEQWSFFWKKERLGNIILKTEDGVDIKKGDNYFNISDSGVINKNLAYANMNKDICCYSTLELAQKAKVDNISNLEIENEIINGEHIILYGVCNKSSWQLCETTSSKLYYPKDKLLSQSWKYFRSKIEREEYIFENKLRFSYNNVLDIVRVALDSKGLEFINYIEKNYAI